MAETSVLVTDDRISNLGEGAEIAIDRLSSGLEARRKLVNRGMPAFSQGLEEGEDTHHLPVAPNCLRCGHDPIRG